MPNSSEVEAYRISPLRRWGLCLVLGPIVMGLLWLGLESGPADRAAFLGTAGLVLLIGAPFQLMIDRARLELSPEGVRLRQTGFELCASWENIIELRAHRGAEGFVTRDPICGGGAATLAAFRGVSLGPGLQMYDAERQQLLEQRRFIPIEAFAWHIRHGAMREALSRFAPGLAAPLDDAGRNS